MSINQTTLPDFVVAALYTNNLLEEPSNTDLKKLDKPNKTAKEVAVKKTAATLQYLGKNQKQFLIFVTYETEVHLPDEQLVFLGNILAACQLNLADVAIINTHNQKISVENIEQLGAKYIVLFGVDYSLLHIPAEPLYQLQKIDDRSIFAAAKLEMHNQSSPEAIQLKKYLWVTLKQMMQLP